MKKMYYATAVVLLSGVCLLTGCSRKTATTEIAPVKVKVEKVGFRPIAGTQRFSGTVEEVAGTALSFTTGGTVKEIRVAPGQMVARGTLLAEVDETSLRNAYEATLATRQQAEDAYARMKQLHDNNSLPEIQWIEIQSKLKQAVAAEQIAKKSLDDCKLYAPFSGYIADKMVEIGQNVLPGVPVLKLVRIEQVKVKVSVPENEIAGIKKGQTMRIQAAVLGDAVYEGVVTETGVTAHPLSRSYDVKALVDNPKKELLPGMVCNVSWGDETEQQAILLPNRVVLLDGHNQEFVWINAGGKAAKRMVRTGDLVPGGVVVTDGLNGGEEVIVEGQQKVSEGMEITY